MEDFCLPFGVGGDGEEDEIWFAREFEKAYTYYEKYKQKLLEDANFVSHCKENAVPENEHAVQASFFCLPSFFKRCGILLHRNDFGIVRGKIAEPLDNYFWIVTENKK